MNFLELSKKKQIETMNSKIYHRENNTNKKREKKKKRVCI
jgi:hypothetical protein